MMIRPLRCCFVYLFVVVPLSVLFLPAAHSQPETETPVENPNLSGYATPESHLDWDVRGYTMVNAGEDLVFRVTSDKSITVSLQPDNLLQFDYEHLTNPYLHRYYTLHATEEMIGEHPIVVSFRQGRYYRNRTYTIWVKPKGDELVFGDGVRGNPVFSVSEARTRESIQPLLQHTFFTAYEHDRIGGGLDRIHYITTGRVYPFDGDDVVVTHGPLTQAMDFPNIVQIYRQRVRWIFNERIAPYFEPVNYTFSAFPTGNSLPVQYNGGEVRAAVGDFLGKGSNQLAVAQGIGGNQVVRLFEYTPRWTVVGQFYGLVSHAADNNARGGLTLAAGDLDNDGKDELVVGQTNSATSLTQFHVIDVDENGNLEQRHPYAAFYPPFRGNGGIEIVVADVDGNGRKEIVCAGKGNDRSHGDARDTAPLNLISVIHPIVENNTITGFERPDGGIVSVFSEEANPSGALSIAAGELNGNPEDGDELVIGTGAMVEVDGYTVTAIKPAPVARYKIVKPRYSDGKIIGLEHFFNSQDGLVSTASQTGDIYVGLMDMEE